MEKISADEFRSQELVAQNIGQLKTLFPEAFTEGKIDFEVLKQLLGGQVEEREEKYGLNWHGKRRARQLALTPSLGTLRPCPEESVAWETTQNIMIEGDNLEVLKLLQKSYASRIKLIYIDPPYNTGKDFVYRDDFRDNIKNYLQVTGQIDGNGHKVSSNSESSGRFHTDWLSMVYPRLKTGHSLLQPEGFLAVSIDDSELSNLRLILDEIFGEENFLTTLVYDRNRKNDARFFSVGHEYMVIYARDKAHLIEQDIKLRAKKEGVQDVKDEWNRLRALRNDDWTEVTKGLKEFYSGFKKDDPRLPLARYTKVDEKGPYRQDGDPSWPGGNGPRYEVLHPVTKKACKIPKSGWRYPTPERFWEEVDKGRIVFGPDETTTPSVRRNLFESDDQVMRSVTFSYAQTASNQFTEIFDGLRVFDNPKSYTDLTQLIDYLSSEGDIVLDFFAGSGTTAHSTMLCDTDASVPRRFILVQLPEKLDPKSKEQETASQLLKGLNRPLNIAELTKERIRRSGRNILKASPYAKSDFGFRVFKLDSSNLRVWEPNPSDLEQMMTDHIDHVVPDRSEQDLLFELLLKRGLDLCSPIETRQIADKVVYTIAGVLFSCLAEQIMRSETERLALGIVKWREELAPELDSTVMFRDSAFVDDVAKANTTEILKQHGFVKVESL